MVPCARRPPPKTKFFVFQQDKGHVTDAKKQIPDFMLVRPFTTVCAFVTTVCGKFDDCLPDRAVQFGEGLFKGRSIA